MQNDENGKAPAPEKSNFTRRCSLLSRYLKEKGSFGNINLGLDRNPNSSLALPGNSDPPRKQNDMHNTEIKPLELISKGEPSDSSGGKGKDFSLSESKTESSQLTIFFKGEILVFNEFPADKAKEIMELANQSKHVTEANIPTQINVENTNNKTNMAPLPDLNEPTNSAGINKQQNQVVERIARRASLHRFFAKRKDRAVSRAPYQVNQNAGHGYPPKPESAPRQQLHPGQSSQQMDNNTVAQTVSHHNTLMEVEEEEENGQCSKHLQLWL